MLDLHRHDEGSLFDGFGKPSELAKKAKELGYTSLGISNHGNMVTAVKHNKACKEEGIKPILGLEGYFVPTYKPQHRGFHLCLFAKNPVGYKNLNIIQYEGEKQKYYNSIWTLGLIEKHHEGLICTTACVASFFAQMIKGGKVGLAEKLLLRFKEIFADDFYVEIQPYKISEEGLQEQVNYTLMKLADRHGIKCIMTSDSHYGSKEDFDTYIKMHEIAGRNAQDIAGTYLERYMPTEKDLIDRFIKMHSGNHKYSIDNPTEKAHEMIRGLQEIEDKVDDDIFEQLPHSLPRFDQETPSKTLLKSNIKEGLKRRGITSKEYIERAKIELDVINHHGVEDYFLMVQDYVQWAKKSGIAVGAGRGSCCNFVVNYALGITEVDSLHFKLEPRRFLMKERHKMPDIDIDFESERRNEVITYLLNKYKGQSAKICSYGLYQVDNLVNDLGKVCGLPQAGVDKETKEANKRVAGEIKAYIRDYIDEAFLDTEGLKVDGRYKRFNHDYDNIIKHFLKLYNKIRFIGTHAAGVAITGGDILQYTSLRIDKNGDAYTMYDLTDMEDINVVKFDMLGLRTMSEIGECRKLTGVPDFQQSFLTDPESLKSFNEGRSNGVFQLDKASVQQLLVEVNANTFSDVVAVTAMNRPGPLKQKMPQLYAHNKSLIEQGETPEGSYFDRWLGKTYGTIIYQEQVMQMAVDIAGMTWDEAHNITKMKIGVNKFNHYFENDYPKFEARFIEGCKKLKVPESIAKETFNKFYHYSFNEGHSVGYTFLSAEQMYYKVHYPNVFWYTKLKYTADDTRIWKYLSECVSDGGLVFLPHVNFTASYSLRKVDGEYVIQQGTNTIQFVGTKAAEFIEEERKANGRFKSMDDFVSRCKNRAVTTRVIEALRNAGSLEFDKDEYINRIKAYNISLYQKGTKVGK